MKSLLLVLMLLVTAQFSYAQLNEQSAEELFSEVEEEFEFERFSEEGILLQVDKDAELACDKDGLCTLVAVSNKTGGRFSVEFTIGRGNAFNGGGGTNIFTGNGFNQQSQDFYAVTARYGIGGKCTQEIKVPRSIYYSVNIYMYSLVNEKGGARSGFTPASEAMIMFVNTLMSRATGCNNQGRN